MNEPGEISMHSLFNMTTPPPLPSSIYTILCHVHPESTHIWQAYLMPLLLPPLCIQQTWQHLVRIELFMRSRYGVDVGLLNVRTYSRFEKVQSNEYHDEVRVQLWCDLRIRRNDEKLWCFTKVYGLNPRTGMLRVESERALPVVKLNREDQIGFCDVCEYVFGDDNFSPGYVGRRYLIRQGTLTDTIKLCLECVWATTDLRHNAVIDSDTNKYWDVVEPYQRGKAGHPVVSEREWYILDSFCVLDELPRTLVSHVLETDLSRNLTILLRRKRCLGKNDV